MHRIEGASRNKVSDVSGFRAEKRSFIINVKKSPGWSSAVNIEAPSILDNDRFWDVDKKVAAKNELYIWWSRGANFPSDARYRHISGSQQGSIFLGMLFLDFGAEICAL